MHLLQQLLDDYQREAGDTPHLDAVLGFVDWCLRDLEANPLTSTQAEPGRVVLHRASPRDDATMPVGVTIPEGPFRPIEVTNRGYNSSQFRMDRTRAVSAFDGGIK